MTESFGVETISLDLPALVGALSRRLHDAGLPVTPARAADVARALTLVRPVSRGTLYWTIRSVVVTEDTQVKVFDAVFAEVFGGASDDRARGRARGRHHRPRLAERRGAGQHEAPTTTRPSRRSR